MSASRQLPNSICTLTDVAALEAAAHRDTSACGDGTIVWRQWGNGEPVLLLHGGSGSWNHWVRNIAALVQSGYRVLAPDLPGFGDSAKTPDGGDADAMPRWLNDGLSQLIGTEAIRLVGFSFGGMVSSLLAANYPERARGLVLVGAPALETTSRSVLNLRAWNHLPEGPSRDAIHRHNLTELMLARQSSIDELALRLHADNLNRDRLRRRQLAWSDIVVKTLTQVHCPVHGIWGANDAVYRGREQIIRPALARAPDFRDLHMLPGAGHWVQFEEAEAFNTCLVRALAEQA